jgi:heterodisulfide reductase subunit A-like polyferredoxin
MTWTKEAIEKAAQDLQEGKGCGHIDKTTTQADWDALNPNSLETDCRDCGAYFTMEWKENEKPPEELKCPQCGSCNHGSVGSPAGGMHLAMFDPRLP